MKCQNCIFIGQAPHDNPIERQDLNESTLDLSLGQEAHEQK